MTTLVISTDAPAVAGPPQGHWTYAGWEQLPADGKRYEIIDGALYMTTAPSSFHQWIVQELVEYIGIPAKNQSLGSHQQSAISYQLLPGRGSMTRRHSGGAQS